LDISCVSDFLGRAIRKNGTFTVVVLSAGDGRVVDIYLTLITSKPRFINPSEVSSARAEIGICCITACMGFWNLG
jgi:hypothetical protein